MIIVFVLIKKEYQRECLKTININRKPFPIFCIKGCFFTAENAEFAEKKSTN